MDFLYFLEGIRTPLLDAFMLTITQIGEETVFLVTALILFWCVNKRLGYYIMSVGFIGTLANQFMKLTFRIPRPWVIDENFTILEQAREAASGYSFPSGHTQSAVGTFGSIANTTKHRWLRNISIVIAILVPFSRMYIGVHTPLDVIVAAVIAVALILLLKPIVLKNDGKYIPPLLIVMTVLAVGYLCFVELFPFPDDIDAANLASGIKNAYTLLGALFGLLVVYIVDENWLKFSTQAVWWAQVLKVVCGLGAVLIVKSGLKAPIQALFGNSVGTAVRYFLIVIVAGIVWPLSFRWFAKLGSKN
jgi:membrane-associated phospholipid phosphatase